MEIIDQMVSAASGSSKDLRKKLHRLNRINGFRDKRVERMDAIQKILIYMCPMVELSTLSVGHLDTRGIFTPFCDYQRIANNTDLCLLRVKRAFKDLKEAGYIHVKRMNKQLKNGFYIGLTAVKTFTEIFFEHLNINSVWLKHNREWKKQRDRLKHPAPEPTIKEQRAQHKIIKQLEGTVNILANKARETGDNRREQDRREKEHKEYRDRLAYDKACEMRDKTGRPIQECLIEVRAAMNQPTVVHEVLAKKPVPTAVPVRSEVDKEFEKHLQATKQQSESIKPTHLTNLNVQMVLMGRARELAAEQGRDYADVIDELKAGLVPT